MQLFALDNNGELIHANQAKRDGVYYCIECGLLLGIRQGSIRISHFYHSNPNQKCSLHQKSLRHLQVQWFLQNELKECQLERSFPEIKRIADVVWEKEKLIFEVQCSPINANEIRARNCDYFSLGYNVIWILHDLRFNKRTLCGAEAALLDRPHYFTNIDRNGVGMIYDQYAYIRGGIRYQFLNPVKVDLSKKLFLYEKFNSNSIASEKHLAPRLVLNRIKNHLFFFRGDVFDRENYCKAALRLEEKWDKILLKGSCGNRRNFLYRLVVLPYLCIFQYIFELICDESSLSHETPKLENEEADFLNLN